MPLLLFPKGKARRRPQGVIQGTGSLCPLLPGFIQSICRASVTSFPSISASVLSPVGFLMGNQAFLGIRAWPCFPFPLGVQVPHVLAGDEPGLLTEPFIPAAIPKEGF